MSENYNKIAVDFLQHIIDGKIELAYERFVDMNGKHHNMYFPAGFESLKKAMLENHEQFPNKQMTVKQVIAENDTVVANSHIIPKPGDPGIAAVHIFRFESDKIVEMWDCVQQIPGDMPNSDGAF